MMEWKSKKKVKQNEKILQNANVLMKQRLVIG